MELWREERGIGTNCPKLRTNGHTDGHTDRKSIFEVGAPPKKVHILGILGIFPKGEGGNRKLQIVKLANLGK